MVSALPATPGRAERNGHTADAFTTLKACRIAARCLAKRPAICGRSPRVIWSFSLNAASASHLNGQIAPHPAVAAQPPLAFPPRLHQASGDGRIGDPFIEDPDRQDAGAGRLGELQIVRRIWPGRRHLHRHVLQRMAPDATLIAIDTNADFTRYLRRDFDDPRLFAVTGSAADVAKIIADRGFEHADYILSGLPFSTLPPGVGETIAEETAAAFPRGRRLPGLSVPPKVREFMAPFFDRIDRGFEWINIPPATLFWA